MNNKNQDLNRVQDDLGNRIRVFSDILDQVWIIIVTVMIILSQVGFVMKEAGSIRKIQRNTAVLLKTILVIGVSSLTFFIVGFGLSMKAMGGLLGQDHFIGTNYQFQDYTIFIFYLSLCIMMSTIATGPIAERTSTDTYLFFSFVTSGFIFPLGVAWVWNDGWLENLGYKDYGGASLVHLMGGLAGFMGTWIIGPRIGMFKQDTTMSYVYKDKFLENDEANYRL